MAVLVAKVWSVLKEVSELSFSAESQSDSPTGWDATAIGRVEVSYHAPNVLIFEEQGRLLPSMGNEREFLNTYRWTLQNDESIRLEHLRLGAESPVFLVDLVEGRDGILVSTTPHLCSCDLYEATLVLEDKTIRLNWAVDGPQKKEKVNCVYR